MKIIGFLLIICAFAGIAHGGINSGAIMGIFIGLALLIAEYMFAPRCCTAKNRSTVRH